MGKRNPVVSAVVVGFWLLATAAPICAQIYWSESTRNGAGITSTSIMRSNLDGSNIQTIITQGGASGKFGGVALDLLGGKFYSGDLSSLFNANLDGSGRTPLVPTSLQIADVELDVPHGKIYWSDFNNSSTNVWWANLNGTAAAPLATFTSSLVEGLGVDSAGGHVYFALNGNSGNDTIQRMNLDGSGRIPCVDLGSVNANPFDVELDLGRSLLYTNLPGSGSILNAPLTCGAPVLLANPPNGTFNGFHFNQQQDSFYVWGNLATQIDRFAANGSGTVTLVSGRTFGNYIDVVPEPSTLSLIAVLSGLFGLRARRRL